MVEYRQILGLAKLQKAVDEVIRVGNSQSVFRNLISPFNARSPQLFLNIDRTKVESLNISVLSLQRVIQMKPIAPSRPARSTLSVTRYESIGNP